MQTVERIWGLGKLSLAVVKSIFILKPSSYQCINFLKNLSLTQQKALDNITFS